MKIIFVTDLDLWSMGNGKGGEAFTRTISKYRDMNDDLYLVSDVKGNEGSELFDKGENIFVHPSFAKRFIKVKKIGLIFRYIDHKITNRRFEKVIDEIAKYSGGDVILYAYEIFGVEACKKVSEKYSIPFVSRFQGTKMIGFPYNLKNRLLRYPHYQALATESNLVIMTDDGSKGDEILDTVGNKSKCLFIKNGLELRNPEIMENIKLLDKGEFRESLDVEIDDTMFLTVSRLTGWKKVDRAIRGFKLFLQKGGKGKLVVVGEGDQRSVLEKITRDFGIEKYVIFVGAVKHGDVYNYMIASDVFLSLFDLSNVGNPLLEAMTLGKCIITLDVGNTKSVVNGNNGVLLSQNDLDSLGDIMFELSKSPEKRRRYGEKAREYAIKELHTWDERMDIEYREVCGLLGRKKG